MSVLVSGSFDWTLELEFRAMHLVGDPLTFYYLNQCFFHQLSFS